MSTFTLRTIHVHSFNHQFKSFRPSTFNHKTVHVLSLDRPRFSQTIQY